MSWRGWAVAFALAIGITPPLRADDSPPPAESARHSTRLERLQRRLEHLREGLPAAPSAASVDSAGPAGSSPPPSGSALPPLPAYSALAQKWAELAATRGERRERHRAALLHAVGARLSDPEVKAELALHATRTAELTRLEFLAQNARAGQARTALLARVSQLSAREAERHRKRLASLLSKPAASASAAPAAPPTSASSRTTP